MRPREEDGTMNTTYTVGALRAAGLEAKWGRTRNGGPILLARRAGRTYTDGKPMPWCCVTAATYNRAQKIGWSEAFDNATALIEYFSIPG